MTTLDTLLDRLKELAPELAAELVTALTPRGARYTFSPPVELALSAGLPELLAALSRALPKALAEPLDDYRGTIAGAADAWARELLARLARVLTPPVHVDATATGAPVGVVDNG